MSERNERMIAEFNATSSSRYGLLHPNRNEDWLRIQLLEKDRERDEAVRRAVEEERNSITSLIESLKLSNCMPHEYKINPSAWQFAEGVVKKTKRELLKYLTPPTSDISSEGNSK